MSRFTRHFIIPGFERYGITADGNVIDFESNCNVDWVFPNNETPDPNRDVPYVSINGELIAIPYLLIQSFVGPCSLEICKRGSNWYTSRNITYRFDRMTTIDENDEFFLDEVRFKIIPSHHGYAISEDGVVFDLANFSFTHHTYTPNDYRCISLRRDGSPKEYDRILIHRLVYETYVGPITDGYDIDHKDTNIYHNHYSNLQQITHEENIHRSFFDKTGRNRDRMRWQYEDIVTMCEMMQDGYSSKEIAKALNTDLDSKLTSLLKRIRSGTSYKSLGAQYDFSNYSSSLNRRVLSPRERAEAIQMIRDEFTINEIASRFDCDPQNIKLLARQEGLKNRSKKFTSSQVKEIKDRLDNGMSVGAAMREYEACRNTIIRIKRGHYDEVIPRDGNPYANEDAA